MLKPKALTKVLSQMNTGGVTSTLLLNSEGVLLAYSGYGETNATVTAAIAANVWRTYEKHGQETFHGDKLNTVLIQCQDGQVAVARTANLLICVCANNEVTLGMLKAKLEALAEFLQEPLSQLAN